MKIAPLRERDGNLVNNWYIAALSRTLDQKKIIKSDIYDESLVLYRDASGKAVALKDRCIHRHTQLSRGKVCDGQIQCPYHGWKYNSVGEVVEIPSAGKAHAIPSQYKLKSYPVVEQDECIWVWMGEENPTAQLPPFRFPNFSTRDWRHYFMETWFDNEVTHLAENFMDVPHTVFVHAGWFRNRALKSVPISVDVTASDVLVTYHQSADNIGFSGRVLNPRGKPMTHTDRFIMPNITRVDYNFGDRGFVIVSQCTPVSTLRSKVYTAIIFKMGFLNFAFDPFFRFYTRQVIDQDVEIMQNQGENFAQDFSMSFRSTDADVVHTAIERLRSEGMSPTPRPIRPLSLEKEIWI